MPDLVRLYIQQVAVGFGLAGLLVLLLLAFDIAGLRHLIAHTAEGPLALFLLWFFNGIVFAGVQFGIVVMGMADKDDDDDGPDHHDDDDGRVRVPLRVRR